MKKNTTKIFKDNIRRNLIRRLPKFLSKLRNDEKAVAALEFVLIAPVMFLTIIGALEIGVIIVSSVIIEGAVTEASRAGLTGFSQNGLSRQEYLENLLNEKTFGLLDVDELKITPKIYGKFEDINMPEPYVDVNSDGEYSPGIDNFTDMNCNGSWDEDIGTEGYGNPGDIVVYNVEYSAKFMTNFFINMIADEDGKIRLTTSTAIKNEPFGTPSPDCIPQIIGPGA